MDAAGLRTAFAVIIAAVVLAGFSTLALRPLRELDDLRDDDHETGRERAGAGAR